MTELQSIGSKITPDNITLTRYTLTQIGHAEPRTRAFLRILSIEGREGRKVAIPVYSGFDLAARAVRRKDLRED
jgi:hypothetical protein